MTRARSKPASLVVAGLLAISLCESLTARPAVAEVYRYMRASLESVLSGIVGSPERRARDLIVNGQPLRFTPYQSDRDVADITDEWLAALRADTRFVPVPVDPVEAELAVAANRLVVPKLSRVHGDFSVIVRFFDGDGPAAFSFLRAGASPIAADPANNRAIPGTTVSVLRPDGSRMTDVLMTRFDDTAAGLAAFTASADIRRLPAALRPPAGAEVLSDIGDQGSGHISRTVISSGVLSAATWRNTRSRLLERDGFTVEITRPGKNGVLAMHARRGSVEADVLYTNGSNTSEIVEVIAIRQLLVEGKTQ